MKFIYWFLKIITFIPILILFPTRIKGKKNWKKGKGILVCNHQSNLDGVIISSRYIGMPYFLAKKELYKTKFSTSLFNAIGGIAVDRKELGLSTIKKGLSVLKENKKLIIFPEGTRKLTMEESEGLKNGASMFAVKTQSPITPMFFTKKPGLFRFTTLVVGEPFNINDLPLTDSNKENIAIVGDKIKQSLLELKHANTKRKKDD